MNKNEQDMIRKIKEKSEQVPVPKALEPRQIEAKLAGKKKKVWTPARISGLAAACLVLIVGVMVYQNYFKMEDATRDDKIACSDVTISDSTKVESAAEYKDVYAYLEKYKKDQERDSAYTSSGARSLNDIRVDESADSKASGDAAQNIEESSTAAADTGMASGSYSETNVRQEGVDEGDTAKTDGTYLYVLKDKSDQIAIIDTRDNRMKQTATITVEDVSEIQEMYLEEAIWKLFGLYEELCVENNGIVRYPRRLPIDCYVSKTSADLTENAGWCYGNLGIVRSLMKTAKYLRKPMEYAYYLDKLVDILAQPAKEYNLSSPIVCHGYGSVISIQKYAFLESQDERCLVNLERNVEITLKEHRKKMQDEGYRKDFSI